MSKRMPKEVASLPRVAPSKRTMYIKPTISAMEMTTPAPFSQLRKLRSFSRGTEKGSVASQATIIKGSAKKVLPLDPVTSRQYRAKTIARETIPFCRKPPLRLYRASPRKGRSRVMAVARSFWLVKTEVTDAASCPQYLEEGRWMRVTDSKTP